jgi:hypothetical protein
LSNQTLELEKQIRALQKSLEVALAALDHEYDPAAQRKWINTLAAVNREINRTRLLLLEHSQTQRVTKTITEMAAENP